MLRLGVPEYRIPRELIELEIQSILALGPSLKLNQALGRDFTLADLRRDFDAVYIAIGTYHSRKLNIEGEQLDGILRAVDFLINVNLGSYNLDLGQRVLVIGGGNVAMDVARTAARLGHQPNPVETLKQRWKWPRSRRLGTTREVHTWSLKIAMRCWLIHEIAEAEEEGIMIHNHFASKSIREAHGHLSGLETIDVARAFDERGRFNPQLIPGTEKIWECDSLIISIGQTGELEWVQPGDGLETTPHGTLKVDPATLATTAKGVYAGGDIAFGPRLVVNAVADGQRAARSIHIYLQQLQPRVVRKGFFTPVPKRKYADIGPVRDYLRWQRRLPPVLAVERRIGVSRVGIGYDESTARQQGGRCLICTLNPIFDGDLCILCNGCVDVCPMDCLKLVPVPALLGDERVAAVIKGYTSAWEESSAMLLDPTRCIRCGLCAARCPTEAVKMEQFRFTEEVLFDPVD
jgi:thioredoxin reductase/NAD-dependent dihydropyrimidine dehydrogenase PreA subunit